MNTTTNRSVLEESELELLIKNTYRIGKNPKSDHKELREAAQMHAIMAAHNSACVINLLDNADEAEMNIKMGEERRAEKRTK